MRGWGVGKLLVWSGEIKEAELAGAGDGRRNWWNCAADPAGRWEEGRPNSKRTGNREWALSK